MLETSRGHKMRCIPGRRGILSSHLLSIGVFVCVNIYQIMCSS